MKVVHTPTQQDYDTLMRALEKKGGYSWEFERSPTSYLSHWDIHQEKTCVDHNQELRLNFSDKKWYIENGYTIITLEEALKELNISMEKTLENLEVGDLIRNSRGNNVRVLAALNDPGAVRAYLLSCRSEDCQSDELGSASIWSTVADLRRNNYLPYSPVKMTLAEVAAKLGYEVEIVK